MNLEKIKESSQFLRSKVKRFKPIAFLRKNIYIFSIFLLFLLSHLLGVWNIKRFEIYQLDGEDIDGKINLLLESYIDENILGENFFSFSPSNTQFDMYEDISFLKSIRIEKSIPNKVVLFVELYEPKYVSYLKSGECNILSSGGMWLEKVCEDTGEECCAEKSVNMDIPFLKSSEMDLTDLDNGRRKLLLMDEIDKVVTIVEVFKYDINKVSLENDILEITEKEGRVFRFSMADDINTQIRRYVVVIGKIRNDYLDFSSLDLRFERPVMKD
jgi:hypothetical protein